MSFYKRVLQRLRPASVKDVTVESVELIEAAAPPVEGFVEERSANHAAGWMQFADGNTQKPDFSIKLNSTGEILARGKADQYRLGEGRERRGFFEKFPRTLSGNEVPDVVVCGPDGSQLPAPEWLRPNYQPVMLVAMDIVDNCNLRCPFCLYDYGNTHATHMMTLDTLEAAIRFAPYTLDGNFWFSCLHEPTLHPQFTAFLRSVPEETRHKLFFTTNLAKRMKPEFFAFLADSGIGHLNISIESREPELYERMRKGARFRIFMENWDQMIAAHKLGAARPRLRYIVMVYKSNLEEIPDLTKYLIEERCADEVQLRFTFDVPHIAKDFKESEFLDDADWITLQNSIAHLPQDKICLVLPPQSDVGTEEMVGADDHLPGRFEFKISWDGQLIVKRYWSMPYDGTHEERVADINVRDIPDALEFLRNLPA